ncbi:TetR family transcriptional regulator [Acinetobacter calcoaceticus]|uniref:TetR family transcriptional regulator n=1 Tax=Acinetobacter calcoaceticus TaxID=471 RepID=A0A4R1XBZ6_ACICA|nr:TetR family transcriptional regulator [Acinetobacter calcoaceticus]
MSSHVKLTAMGSEVIKVMLSETEKKSQQDWVESDKKIIQHTILLLAKGGINAVTMQAVGEGAGYSRGIITRRYGSKEKLLLRVLHHLNDWFRGMLIEATWRQHGITAIESLIKAMADRCYEYAVEVKAYFTLCCMAETADRQFNRSLLGMRKEMTQCYIQWLKEARVLEEITRNVDIEMMADLIMSAVMGLVQSWMINPRFNLALRLKQLAEIQLRNMFKNSHMYYSTNYWGE